MLEIISSNVSVTFITCPSDPRKTLGIKLPFLVMIIKNLKKYFTFEVQVRLNLAKKIEEKSINFPSEAIVVDVAMHGKRKVVATERKSLYMHFLLGP